MSVGHYYSLCNRYHGRAVEIRTHNGEVYRGRIQNVCNRRKRVFLDPLPERRNLGGFGSGFYGGYGRFRRRRAFVTGIALGSIATLILLPFFFL